jgi:integrase
MHLQAPANDDFFFIPRARNSPIKSSYMAVEGLPSKLKIFRISGSKYWQVRIFSGGRYLGRSLKTTEVDEAKTLAKNFYETVVMHGKVDVAAATDAAVLTMVHQNFLHDLIQEVLFAEQDKVKRDEIKHASYVMTKIRLEGLIFDFFKGRSLHKINAEVLTEFITFLTHKNLAVATIQGYMAQTRKLLKLLCGKGVIQAVPAFPSLKAQLTSRGAFTLTEYKAILRKSKDLRDVIFSNWGARNKPWIKSEYHQMPHEMNWLIRFMVYTFVRPGDIRQIKNKHVEVIRGAYHYLRLNLPEVKRHKAATVSLSPAVQIFENVQSYQTMRGFGQPDDYVFFPEEQNRRLVLDIAGWAFNWILKDLGIKAGPHGTDRSLYSLRHTAITFRLIYGGNIDLLTLARNARTSVEMIDKFYASTLSAEMNIALLHSKRR